MDMFADKTRQSRLPFFCPREDIKQINAENKQHYGDNKTEDERGRSSELKGRSQRTDSTTEDKEGRKSANMKQELRSPLLAFFGKACGHRKYQSPDHCHAGGHRSNKSDYENRAIADIRCCHQVHNAQLLQHYKQRNKRASNRQSQAEI